MLILHVFKYISNKPILSTVSSHSIFSMSSGDLPDHKHRETIFVKSDNQPKTNKFKVLYV